MKKVLFPILALVLALGLALPMAVSVLATDEVYPNNVHDSWQGTQKGGGTIGGDRSDPNDALGAIDNEFFSLGFKSNGQGGFEEEGGWIILEFDDYVGTSITIVEQSPGTGYGYPLEEADVYVSADAASWTLLGTANNQIAGGNATGQSHQNVFDLEECIKFVKIVDVTDPTLHTNTGDAFDLDSVWAGPCPVTELVTNLCAAQDIQVGTVTVDNDGDTLYVTYSIAEGYEQWVLTETHLHVFVDDVGFSDIPMAKSKKHNNPIPGQFDYSMMHDPPVSEYTYDILLDDIGDGVAAGDSVYIAAHAEVYLTEAVVYGTERGPGGASNNYGDIYEIDLDSGTATKLFRPNLNLGQRNYPNGNAFDTVNNRLYYSSNDSENTPSDLYFYDFGTSNQTLAGTLNGVSAGASFYNGKYYYIANRTDDLMEVTLIAGGTIASETKIADITGNGKGWGFGDIVIRSDGVLFGSPSGEFFKFDLNTLTYTSISTTGAVGMQLAFGSNGVLYGHSAGTGEFFTIDPTDGTTTPIGYATGSATGQFTDLASGPLPSVWETAWGGACDSENYWDGETGFVYFFNPDGKGNWASYFEYHVE